MKMNESAWWPHTCTLHEMINDRQRPGCYKCCLALRGTFASSYFAFTVNKYTKFTDDIKITKGVNAVLTWLETFKNTSNYTDEQGATDTVHNIPCSKMNDLQKITFTTQEHEHSSKITTTNHSKTVSLSSTQHKRNYSEECHISGHHWLPLYWQKKHRKSEKESHRLGMSWGVNMFFGLIFWIIKSLNISLNIMWRTCFEEEMKTVNSRWKEKAKEELDQMF